MSQKKAIVVCGPTASGKTSLAIDLATMTNSEIINADSVQIFKYLNIGSAKPTREEQQTVPHHMIDVAQPDEIFSGGRYSEMARQQFDDIIKRGKNVVICGGTGLYIKSLVNGLFNGPSADQNLREDLKNIESKNPGYLHQTLFQVDPDTAKRLNQNDHVRLIRALEVYYLTNIPISTHHEKHRKTPPYCKTFTYVLDPGKEVLEKRIHKRVKEMLNEGFVDEVQGLLDMGYSPDLRSMQSVGYKQVLMFLSGKISRDKLEDEIANSHIKYVKQQRTFFREFGIQIPDASGINPDEINLFFSGNLP
ncbi:MAG: tRNA (adenosine(37)-N6)-dimethylallyltransferase MiaA [Deltaproteobacteria bacterium]|nr:tRNA (adenosine(37)-N6)-dimethylallyltransferase MiaA [Deltaproteobacteria bacterium]